MPAVRDAIVAGCDSAGGAGARPRIRDRHSSERVMRVLHGQAPAMRLPGFWRRPPRLSIAVGGTAGDTRCRMSADVDGGHRRAILELGACGQRGAAQQRIGMGRPAIDHGGEALQASADWTPARNEWWKWVVLACLGLVIFEWWVYNRRVYL